MAHARTLPVSSVLALVAATLVPRGEAATCGDLNGSGGFTVADCVTLFDVIAGPPDAVGLCGGQGALACGDLVADGVLNVADAVVCLNAVAGNPTLFPLCEGPPSSCVGDAGASTVTVAADVTTHQRWCAGWTYLLDAIIAVHPGVVLTIEPGTVIAGKKHDNGAPSGLVVLRDAKINANGTRAQPIVFTSDQPPGSRAPGDWMGLN